MLAPVLSDGAATYVPGVSERRAGATSYLHGGDKNAEARTSSTGAVTGTRSYDAFGGTLSSTGWQGPAGYGGAFGYREDATNFRLVGHRLYDPVAGRFLSRDPARDGANWYLYCGGDPVNGADPEGLNDWGVGGGVVNNQTPGKDQFEIWAQGDIDGQGSTTVLVPPGGGAVSPTTPGGFDVDFVIVRDKKTGAIFIYRPYPNKAQLALWPIPIIGPFVGGSAPGTTILVFDDAHGARPLPGGFGDDSESITRRKPGTKYPHADTFPNIMRPERWPGHRPPWRKGGH